MPPWASENPRLFVKIHRQALESDVVRESLSHWIDLVFGYKQKGRCGTVTKRYLADMFINMKLPPPGKRGTL